jgi:plastocyanin
MRWERNRLAIAAVIVLATLAAACSSSSSSTIAGTTSTSASTAAGSSSNSSGAVSDVSARSTFDISAQSFFFSPTELDGAADQTLKLTVTNDGTVAHTFTIDSEQVDITLQPGQSQQVSVTFPQSGSVEFYCRFHVSSGMKGTLQVA